MELKDSLGRSEPYILHLPGEGKKRLGYMLDKLSKRQVSVSDEIVIVTTATEDKIDSCPLIKQLNNSSQLYINSAEHYKSEWRKTAKLKLIFNALQYTDRPYTLVLDANDVAILKDIDHAFISKWQQYDCDILFNGSQYLYPKVFSAPIERIEFSPYVNHYLNAGVCFGYTDKIRSLYQSALYHSQHEHYAPYESEQYYIRVAIVENPDVKAKIDDASHLFLTSHGN